MLLKGVGEDKTPAVPNPAAIGGVSPRSPEVLEPGEVLLRGDNGREDGLVAGVRQRGPSGAKVNGRMAHGAVIDNPVPEDPAAWVNPAACCRPHRVVGQRLKGAGMRW